MVNEELIKLVKSVCRITWDDEETTERVTSIAENATVNLHHLFGMPGEPGAEAFLVPGLEKTLYENYCLYCWNNMPEEFEKNYRSDILRVRHRYEVEAAQSEDNEVEAEAANV